MKPRKPRLQLSSLPGAEIFPLAVPGESRICNPSIAISDRGFLCVIRAVHYELDDRGFVAAGSQPRPPLHWNWLATLDRSLSVVGLRPIEHQHPLRLEDCRLVDWRGSWWLSATMVTRDPPYVGEVVLCRLSDATVSEVRSFSYPEAAPVEKNWMPRVNGDRLEWVYWLDPTDVLTFHQGRLARRRIARYGRLEKWSGSSQLVGYGDNWLCVVHQKRLAKRNGGRLVLYRHRFVELDDDFRVKRVSPSFTFEGASIEFCAGLCLTENHAVLSYGVWDRHARIMRVDLSAIEAMLRPYRLPRPLAVAISDFGRRIRPWLRHRWLRQPGKQLRAIKARWRSSSRS